MIVRCLVCIPTYNNSGTIVAVIKDALVKSPLSILVVDDGSDIPVLDLIKKEAELSQFLGSRVNVHRFNENQGKGAAIQQAFKLATAQNYTHIITMDGDAQHKAEDLLVLLEAILLSPWSMIIGKRKLDGINVPSSSKFGRSFSNFWVKYQTDKTIEDSQSGFRAYPLFHVQNLRFYTKKYDFEIEVLIKLLWNQINVKEVKIDVYYPPPELRISHFDKFHDNVKISVLNTVFVVLSLLKSNITRNKIIASMSLGVFIGVMPIYGFQVFVVAFLSFLLRLNFSLMFIASNISIPPLIPVWTYISLNIGSKLTNTPIVFTLDQNILTHTKDFLLILTIGSIVLGVVLASTMAMITYIITMGRGQKKLWTGKTRGGNFGNFFMRQATIYLGPSVAYFFLYFICPYFYIFAPRSVISHNQFFKNLNPEIGFIKRQILVVKTFFKLGQVLVDNQIPVENTTKIFTINRSGIDYIPQSLEIKKGLIMVGAHMGGWMFSAKVFGADEQEKINPIKINVVEFNTGNGQNAHDKIENSKINFIPNSDNQAVFKINQSLEQNEIIVFTADRPLNHNFELVLFLGKLAAIDTTAFKIALAKKSPILFTYGFKGSKLSYDLYITPPKLVPNSSSRNKQETLIELTKAYTESLEYFLRRYPTQWFNFFPFWEALPSEEILLNSKKSTYY